MKKRVQVTCRQQESELSVTDLEVRRLVETGPTAADPIRNPCNHLRRADARIAKELVAALAVGKKGIIGLGSLEARLSAEMHGELLRHAPNTQQLGTGKVDDERRTGHMREGTQTHRIGVALPQRVEMTHCQVDRL